MVAIVDYGMGNLKSLANAFQALGEKASFATNPKDVAAAKKLVFPGVGNFGKAAEILEKRGLGAAIQKIIERGTPFLGICLGFQLLFEASQEAPGAKGLGILRGKVLKFQGIKTPHMGWNQLELRRESGLFGKIKNGSFAYFMHSFYVKPADKKIITGKTKYGIDFCSAIAKNNVFGVQFHPEKSGTLGLTILKNFLNFRAR